VVARQMGVSRNTVKRYLAHHATVITTKGKSFRMRKRGSGSDDDHPRGN